MNPTEPGYSPYSHLHSERTASARSFSRLRNELGVAFRAPQQEAYESYATWDQQAFDSEMGIEWRSDRAGIAVSAGGSVADSRTLETPFGTLHVECSWNDDMLQLAWELEIPLIEHIHVLIMDPNTGRSRREPIDLGVAHSKGAADLDKNILGFSPTQELWTLRFLLTSPE